MITVSNCDLLNDSHEKVYKSVRVGGVSPIMFLRHSAVRRTRDQSENTVDVPVRLAPEGIHRSIVSLSLKAPQQFVPAS